MKQAYYIIIIGILLVIIVVQALNRHPSSPASSQENSLSTQEVLWTPPDTADIPATGEGGLIRYGKNLIVHTAKYFGPKGSISQAENGLNCQNCHIAAGTRLFGNSFSKAASAYPKYRPRRNHTVSIAQRINGCMERSMNGKALDSTSREVKALVAYFKWIGKGVDRKTKLFGEGTENLPFLNRAAGPG